MKWTDISPPAGLPVRPATMPPARHDSAGADAGAKAEADSDSESDSDSGITTAFADVELRAIRILSGTGLPGNSAVVTIAAPVHRRVLAHLRSSRLEQGGLLLGSAWGEAGNCGEPNRLDIVAAVPALDSSGTGYSLRMEAAVWSAANARLDELRNAPEHAVAAQAGALRVLGWYHSHPGLGAFFSSTDCSTQRAFFNHPWSVGWVIDPDDDSHACFIGADSLAVGQCLLVG